VNANEVSDIVTQITRRQWLLRLGETVALAGISGLVPETSMRIFADEQLHAALPAGVYEPSSDALVHALSHKASAPPIGSETDYVRPGVPYQLQFFSPEDFRVVSSFVSSLLGDVEPNALREAAQWVDLWLHSAAGVREAARNLDPLHRTLAIAYFGETSVSEIETADPAAVARQGLSALQKFCSETHGKNFADSPPHEQQEVLRAISANGPDSPLQKFYELVRNQAIRGYYTSAEGLKELDYKGNAYYPYCPGGESENAK
jgi:hypothetical protein